MNQIRPIAICVFRNKNRILVAEGYDSVKDEYFYRPLGGGIEFGESSMETICREMIEEIDVEAFGLEHFYTTDFFQRSTFHSEEIQVISLVRTRTYPRANLESAKVEGGVVVLKKREGGWLALPSTGVNSLSVRNTMHAWIKKGRTE